MMLEGFGVTEDNWRDATEQVPHFCISETPHYVGRAVAALAADPEITRWNGTSLSSGYLAQVYGFTDLDGSQPDAWRYIAEVEQPTSPPTPPATDNRHLTTELWAYATEHKCSTLAVRCTLCGMPTTRPRHFVTETDDLAAALDAAATRWPDLSRSQLLVQLALEGHKAAQQAHQKRRQRRLAALRQHSGALTGAYGPDYLQQLREEWPA